MCACEQSTNPRQSPVYVHEKIVKSYHLVMTGRHLFSLCFFPERLLRRLHSICGITGSDSSRYARQHLCHVSPAQHALPADLAYGSYGPTGRHLETTGLSGLRSQQGADAKYSPLFTHALLQKQTFSALYLRMSYIYKH